MAAPPFCWLSWARTNGSTTPSVSRGLITTRTSEMAASWPLAIFSGPTNRWIWPRAAPTATVRGTRVSMAKIARGQDAAIGVVRMVISPKLTDGVVDPFVRAQLSQPKGGGAAIGGLLLTWWLAGRLFAATSRALDTAYHDRHQRLSIHQRLIALGFAFVSVVVVVLTLGIMVDAPFMDEDVALDIGVSRALITIWS